MFATNCGAPFILRIISISLYLSVTDFYCFRIVWLEAELIETTLTTFIIFCYRSLTEIEVMKLKLNIFTLLKHCYFHLVIQSKEKMQYSCKILWS